MGEGGRVGVQWWKGSHLRLKERGAGRATGKQEQQASKSSRQARAAGKQVRLVCGAEAEAEDNAVGVGRSCVRHACCGGGGGGGGDWWPLDDRRKEGGGDSVRVLECRWHETEKRF